MAASATVHIPMRVAIFDCSTVRCGKNYEYMPQNSPARFCLDLSKADCFKISFPSLFSLIIKSTRISLTSHLLLFLVAGKLTFSFISSRVYYVFAIKLNFSWSERKTLNNVCVSRHSLELFHRKNFLVSWKPLAARETRSTTARAQAKLKCRAILDHIRVNEKIPLRRILLGYFWAAYCTRSIPFHGKQLEKNGF